MYYNDWYSTYRPDYCSQHPSPETNEGHCMPHTVLPKRYKRYMDVPRKLHYHLCSAFKKYTCTDMTVEQKKRNYHYI